ncbi:MAG TPA: AMP-binding protein [Marmoricola sp.]
MSTDTIRDLLLSHYGSSTAALRWRAEDGTVEAQTWTEHLAEASALAAAIESRFDPTKPPHVGVLLGNGPDLALHLSAAGLGGHVLVGLNNTRRGSALARDVAKGDCQFVVTDATHRELLSEVEVPVVERLDRPDGQAQVEPVDLTGDSLFMLIFTSGTGGDPKAVRVTHKKIATLAGYMSERLGLTGDDVHYVSMPLFHSNAVMAGWTPALATGACMAVAPFSATGFLPDVRAFDATYANYVGKPLAYILATPAAPDDADNPLRLVFGNEGGERDIEEFARRFDCRVIDGFGSTENAVVISRIPGTPPNALGQPAENVAVLDPETGAECPRATYDAAGAVTNLDECVGELVNVAGAGQFDGYYNDPEATAERMRDGKYWSGDLAYRDADGWVYFAGRTSDWLRVDGENLAAAPIERLLLRHPAISEAAVYAVPDPLAGDQLMATLVLRAELTPTEFGAFLGAQEDLGTKSWPRFVAIADAIPRTATNKVLKRDLQAVGSTAATWIRGDRDRDYETQPR